MIVPLQRSSAMTLRNARSAVKAGAFKTHNSLSSWLFIFCTLLMQVSVIRMWSHWFEISASLGFYRAAGVLAAVTGAAYRFMVGVNTSND
jgi:cytochrome b subunit of formate dehydrogenase